MRPRVPQPAFLLLTLTACWCLMAADGPRASDPAEKVFKTKQGDVLYLTLHVEGEPSSVEGRFRDRRVPFFKTGRAGEFGALVGIDMADAPETDTLKAEITYPDGVRKRVFRVAVAPEDFREQRMTLPKGQVDPDAVALKRINLEKEKVKAVLAGFTPDRLWGAGFLVPVEGPVTGAFGSKRILNGQPRNQHNGEDIAASLGTPVKATNDGVVRMVDEHFFSGKGVILDHGLGLFTMYFHLDSTAVREGARVKRGDVIGTVGQSGRATGPHLHWGAWINGSRVNPFALARLSFDR
ncbi:MAG: M23 family metallopeptidase [Nitrospirae bacterium]|nr:MAG: M23 family metallopeptidase [Nitrospirota bacterium]